MQLCVCEGVKWHKKAVSVSRWDGESQHYAGVKSIKNKSPHAKDTEFMVLKWRLIVCQIEKTAKQTSSWCKRDTEIKENGENTRETCRYGTLHP